MSAIEMQYDSPFYVTGGTLARDALCYVTRQADHQLHDALRKGCFCYVLTSRQMGKSSLMVRTASRLRDEGVGVVVLDLTAIGQNLSAEQWYGGLLTQMAQQLSLEDELEEFWDNHPGLGPLQRWMQAMRQVVLSRYPGGVVVFIDEIDAVRSLPFSTDEFFAGIREFYNHRTEDPELERLTFCLLGVAAPSDLMRDTRMTPFNIGRRIELHDFSEAEAQVLALGLGGGEQEGAALLGRILYWTGGHPYLTQRLCQTVAEQAAGSAGEVDRLCGELFFARRAREQDDNLLFVRERMLRSEVELAGLMSLYEQVHRGQRVEDDETNPLINVLRLSGIVRAEGGYLQARNIIYSRVFDRAWVAQNLPDAEARSLEPATRLDSFGRTEAATIESEPLRLERTTNRRKNWLWATALVVILACGGLLGFNLVNTRSKPAVLNSYRDWEIVRLTRTGGSIAPDISPDGKYVAYINSDSGQQSLWILQLATSARHQIVPPEKIVYDGLLFTPDGSELCYTRREAGPSPQRILYRIPVLGGVAKKLRDDIDSQVILSPDGAHLAFARRNSEGKAEFIIANADGVEERVLVGRRLESPAWSPDGKVIAFSIGNASSGGDNMSIHEIRLDDDSEREISPRKWNYVGHKSWMPDGSGLIVCAREQKANVNQLWFVEYPSGVARPLSNDLDTFNFVRLTGDARMLVTEQVTSVSDIWSGPLADVASAKKIGVWGKSGLGLMADGRIVYSSLQSGEASNIWVMNADGAEPRQLTTESSNDISAVASPDGRYILFASDRSGKFEIWRMNPDGSNLLQLTLSNGANPPSITPDGKWVIYLSSGDGYLYKVPMEGGEPVRVCGEAVGVSAVSPDGELIAYFAQGKETWGIAVSSFEDGSVVKRFEVGSHSLNNTTLKWTPDGKAFLYALSSDGVSNIWMQPLDGGPPRQVTDFRADGIFRFDVSPDGKNLICSRGGWKRDIVLIKNLR